MKLKKTIALAILAAVLSANLASCVAQRDPLDTGDSYTEGDHTLPIDPAGNASDDEYTAVSKTVYLNRNSTLTPVDAGGTSVTLDAATELSVLAQSTQWYKVSYQGAQYYVSRGRTTEDDLGEKTFTACDKTMYATSALNVRPYPSLGSFSDPIETLTKGDAVQVVSQSSSTGWSKIQFKKNNTTTYGFVKTSYLSSRSDGSKDYEEKFSAITEKTVYVIVENTANLREEPYLPGDNYEGGTLVVGNGVPRGTELTAVAEGTVDDVAWYKVYYKKDAGSKSVVGYITKSSVSEIKPKDSYTVDELVSDYQYTKLSGTVTAYAYGTSIYVRETPSKDGKQLGYVQSGTAIKVYAYGKSLTGTATWCIVETSDGKIGFASYDFLTLDQSGKTMSAIPLSLDHLVNVYGFTKLSANETKTAKVTVNLWGTPDSDVVLKTLTSGTNVTIVATGKIGVDAAYIVWVDNVYYFALQSAFN